MLISRRRDYWKRFSRPWSYIPISALVALPAQPQFVPASTGALNQAALRAKWLVRPRPSAAPAQAQAQAESGPGPAASGVERRVARPGPAAPRLARLGGLTPLRRQPQSPQPIGRRESRAANRVPYS